MTKNDEPEYIIRCLIYDVLKRHRGKEKPISRGALLGKVNMELSIVAPPAVIPSDRKLRAYINWLRFNTKWGAWICATLKGGYFLARNIEELLEYLAPDRRRALNILARIAAQEKLATQQESGQMLLLIPEHETLTLPIELVKNDHE